MTIKQGCVKNVNICTDRKPKASGKDIKKESSSFIYDNLPVVKSQIPFRLKNNDTSKDNAHSKSSNDRMTYLFEKYKSIVHYNSPEPERYGVRAFTKNSEIYIAPGGESALPHELAHVYQQKTQNIPATGKINGEKVNTDSKLEKEADKISKDIGGYIPRVIISGKRRVNSNNVIQFAPPDEESLPELANEESESSEMSFDSMIQKRSKIIPMLKEHPRLALTGGIASIIVSVALVYWLRSRLKERKRILAIDEMLKSDKIFDDKKTFKEVKSSISTDCTKTLNGCITRLKKCCDTEGVKSVIKGANENVMYYILANSEDVESEENREQYFVNRLELMTTYIEKVYKQFKGKYWIRSTGSDPHKDAQHALFLINKITNKIISVYKPHDMSADAAVVGQKGMFAQINKLFKKGNTLDDTPIKGKNAFATMRIDVKKHTEEFITKKHVMTYQEALIYYFQFGMLKAITDAMAIIDLHTDNIMPTEKGPMIIDAEIDFFHFGDHTLLVTGPSSAAKGAYTSNSGFKIKVIEDTGSKCNKKTLLNSAIVFNNNDHSLEECRKKYEEGYNFMIKLMKDQKGVFKEMFREQLKNVNKVRILPIATNVFAENLQIAILYTTEQEKIAKSLSIEIISGLSGESSNFLNNNKNVFPDVNNDNRISVNINEGKLKEDLLQTLKKGTIPSMYVDMEGNIYLYDNIAGDISFKAKPKNKINREKLIEIIISCFLERIHSFKPQPLE